MANVYLVVNNIDDWTGYYPSTQVLTLDEYIKSNMTSDSIRIINLCNDFSYLSEGYYCSLLSEARGHSVIPSGQVLNDLNNPLLYQLRLEALAPALDKLAKHKNSERTLCFKSYFGNTADGELTPLTRLLFDYFPCPILQVNLVKEINAWRIDKLSIISHSSLNEAEATEFANTLDSFSKRIWRQKKPDKQAKYDLAILVEPGSSLSASDEGAIKQFIKAAKRYEMAVELITEKDYPRISEFDALFIRENTNIDHYTYQFAKKAEAEGLVVMDDPQSILRCTNKVFLTDLFNHKAIPTPTTVIITRQEDRQTQLSQLLEKLSFPFVLKIPDGSFSRGIIKIQNEADFLQHAEKLFSESSLLLAQAFLYTDFDWRIGVLNNQPLYACRYYMVKNHWQIYHHQENKKTQAGRSDTLPTFEVPKPVLKAAIKATKAIGNGLYGVDVKESGGQGYVIEVNDNPNIDRGVEDKFLGEELYNTIIKEFVRRIELNRQ